MRQRSPTQRVHAARIHVEGKLPALQLDRLNSTADHDCSNSRVREHNVDPAQRFTRLGTRRFDTFHVRHIAFDKLRGSAIARQRIDQRLSGCRVYVEYHDGGTFRAEHASRRRADSGSPTEMTTRLFNSRFIA